MTEEIDDNSTLPDSAAMGKPPILDYDGTPVSDLRAMITELQQEVADLKRTLRTINYLCNAPYWTSDRRWEIEVFSSRKGEKHG